jgi:hypothetical protein
MLNKADVIYYIKTNLGFPHVTIESSDEQIWMYVKMYTLREFSKYVPDVNELVINTSDSEVKTDVKNIFLIRDPDGCNVLNVKWYIEQEMDSYMTGRPFQGPYTSFSSLEGFLLQMEQGDTAEHFSRSEPNYEFIQPNKIRLYAGSRIPSYIVVRYERSQPEDLSKIPYEREIDFLNLALADTMITMGNIRRKYQSLNTPFGDIPVDTSLAERGETMKTAVIEILNSLPPNVIIEVG